MAQLGFRTINEMIGRTDMLEPRKAIDHWKARGLDFTNILYQPEVPDGRRPLLPDRAGPWPGEGAGQHAPARALRAGHRARRKGHAPTLPISNVNRVVGTILGSEITRRHGADGLAGGHDPDSISRARAGQSFGAFMPQGHDAGTRRRCQRLCRQGPFRRQNHRLSAGRLDLCAGGKHHHRQRRALRRDRRRGLYPRHGGRAFLRAQQRRQRRGRSRWAITAANT